MATSLDDAIIGASYWTALGAMCVVPLSVKNYYINLLTLTVIIPNMLGFMTRRSRFIIDQNVLLTTTIMTLTLTYLTSFMSKQVKEVVINPGKDKIKTLQVFTLILIFFLVSMIMTARILPLYSNYNFV